ncbi:hypothetical protein VZT92_019289 [Zoarces viviparus]|uniref:F-box/LRR-repeat protein 7 n=1 Tax=Zoarces viviparus TaxID=48416 RepID=A0AAW1EL55_ZOAVI
MTMDTSNKHEPQMTVWAANPTMETRPLTGAGRTVSELLEDSGNCRPIINQELKLRLLGDSLFSEQQKLSHVLDWAHSFLSSGSEVNHQFCRADSLILADEEQRERPAYMHPSAAKCHHTVSCTAGGSEVFGHFPDDPCISFSFIPEREKENKKKVFGTARNLKLSYKTPAALSERDISGHTMELSDESAALTTIPGLSPERIGCDPGVEGYQSGVEGQKTKVVGQTASLRPCEKQSVSLSSPTNKEIFQSSTHTPLHDDPGPTSSASGACRCKQTDKYNPAGVPVCDRWLCLLDEVWLSILPLLPHSDLSREAQLCSRLHTLATDHTLCENLRIANSDLTERCLLCVGRRRPHSLCLYSCSGLSLTSCGLQMFFTLCGNFLMEVKVTSCTGPGLHGDQMLRLIGQLCRHVTSVDVGWSGATDTGVKALSDCCPGSCPGVTDLTMHSISKYTPCIRSLDGSGCKAVTDAGVQSLALGCRRLQQLNLSSTGTGNRGVTLLANYCSRQLQTVKLNFCHITLENILKLCRCCKRLKALHLYGCARLPAERAIREVNPAVKVDPLP